jgi:uncharacterized protein
MKLKIHILASIAFITVTLFTFAINAAPSNFPQLTGRVVDQANILSTLAEQEIEQLLEAEETRSTNQVIVVTIDSLDGYYVADYALELGRHWGIGQKDKNNGVVFLIAPNERKATIQVGYGLEHILTDVGTKMIQENIVIPEFKKSDYEAGIIKGTQEIIYTLENEQLSLIETSKLQTQYNDYEGESWIISIIKTIGFVLLVIVIFILAIPLLFAYVMIPVIIIGLIYNLIRLIILGIIYLINREKYKKVKSAYKPFSFKFLKKLGKGGKGIFSGTWKSSSSGSSWSSGSWSSSGSSFSSSSFSGGGGSFGGGGSSSSW